MCIREVEALAKQIEGVYEQILSCAMTEFLERGYTDASLRDIAAKAGTTTGSIYTRFGDKEGLFEAIVGTRFSGMMYEFIEAEIRSTDDYLETLAKLGRPAREISPHLKHIIVTAMFNGFFEMIIHNMPPKEAESYLKELNLFFEAGWAKIMGQ